jgi:outer membrane protein assembly factor BamD
MERAAIRSVSATNRPFVKRLANLERCLLQISRYCIGKCFTPSLLAALLLLGACQADAQILHRKKKTNKSTSADNTVQPDKVLYDRAAEDIKHGKHEVGRLNLQTLINTYPDSEYLAKAKLLIADSYYKEGGTANMTQAISGYKDFIVFFPFLPEASYAQLQVAMAHYQQMEKPDRDRSEAREAETEFQTFLLKYPKDPLADKAMQHLREVQEVLAEGDYRVAYFYYVKGDRRAAAARLIGVTTRYPLFSRSDRALWMLGDIFEKSEKKEIAATYYTQIVRNYPLSNMVPDAKSKLSAMKVPIPQPDPKAVSWMTAEQNAPRPHTSLMKRPMAILKSGPTGEMKTASRVGAPNLEPEPDNSSATDVLTGGNSGTRIAVGGGSGTGSTTGIVATVTPGGAKTETPAAEGTSPAETAPDTATPADATSPVGPTGESSSAAPGVEPTPGATTPAAPAATSATPSAPGGADASAASGSTDTTKADATTTPDSTQSESQKKDEKQKESTSKKKKGLRKIVPW